MLRKLTEQSLWVLLMGLALGVVHLLVRAWPALPVSDKSGGICQAPLPRQPQVGWIKQKDARLLYEKKQALFVDARDPSAFQRAHIAGALSLAWPTDPSATLSAMPDTSTVHARAGGVKKIITYCDTANDCAVSKKLAELLYHQGLHHVAVLEGGMPSWYKNNLPAESGASH